MTPSELTHAAALAALQALRDDVLVVCDGEVLVSNRADAPAGGPAPDWLPEAGEAEIEVDGRMALVNVTPWVISEGRCGAVVTVSALAHRAIHDGLTGLLNQRTFRDRLQAQARRLAAAGRPLSVVVIDLDHFKAVNDEHGHPAGDRVLAGAAARLAGAARAGDTVARIGGEEFAWMLPDVDAAGALVAAQRLRDAIRSAPIGTLAITASMGVCDLETAGGALLERADEALYWAKTHGRDAALAWSPDAARRLAAGFGDPDGHGARTARLAVALAEVRGWGPHAQARLHQAGRVHDAGKALLPHALLNRPGPLSALEREHVRQHARIGAAMGTGVLDPDQVAWVAHHHEDWDGRGYPDGLAGGAIPDGAQLLAIADAYDTMIAGRPYRPALARAEALAEIDRCAGARLRPDAGALIREALIWLEPELPRDPTASPPSVLSA